MPNFEYPSISAKQYATKASPSALVWFELPIENVVVEWPLLEKNALLVASTSVFSKCKRVINDEGYTTYSYETLWPVYNDFTDLITQFKRDQKIEDILEWEWLVKLHLNNYI